MALLIASSVALENKIAPLFDNLKPNCVTFFVRLKVVLPPNFNPFTK